MALPYRSKPSLSGDGITFAELISRLTVTHPLNLKLLSEFDRADVKPPVVIVTKPKE